MNELEEILWPSGYGGKPLSVTVDDGIGDGYKILRKPFSLFKAEIMDWHKKEMVKEYKELLKLTPTGHVFKKLFNNRIKQLKEEV